MVAFDDRKKNTGMSPSSTGDDGDSDKKKKLESLKLPNKALESLKLPDDANKKKERLAVSSKDTTLSVDQINLMSNKKREMYFRQHPERENGIEGLQQKSNSESLKANLSCLDIKKAELIKNKESQKSTNMEKSKSSSLTIKNDNGKSL